MIYQDYMKRLSLAAALIAALTTLSACAGTTKVRSQHHLWSSEADAVPVYFLRPKHRFMGVTGKPISISVDGEKIAELAREQYTLLRLRPGRYEMSVTNWTVEGADNRMVRVTTPYDVELFGPDPAYLVFVPEDKKIWEAIVNALGPIVLEFGDALRFSIIIDFTRPPKGVTVVAVNSDMARAMADDLTAVGPAFATPLAR